MEIDKAYERKIGVIEREIGDKLFFLLWFMTLTQLVLIIWEWIHLVCIQGKGKTKRCIYASCQKTARTRSDQAFGQR